MLLTQGKTSLSIPSWKFRGLDAEFQVWLHTFTFKVKEYHNVIHILTLSGWHLQCINRAKISNCNYNTMKSHAYWQKKTRHFDVCDIKYNNRRRMRWKLLKRYQVGASPQVHRTNYRWPRTNCYFFLKRYSFAILICLVHLLSFGISAIFVYFFKFESAPLL